MEHAVQTCVLDENPSRRRRRCMHRPDWPLEARLASQSKQEIEANRETLIAGWGLASLRVAVFVKLTHVLEAEDEWRLHDDHVVSRAVKRRQDAVLRLPGNGNVAQADSLAT
eukprot:6210245-Pleurochrysis_carterae.AAC.1